MSCPNPIELSRALVAGIDDRLRMHLELCDQCSAELAAHSAIATEARRLPVFEPSPDHARSVRNALLVAARTPAPAARPRLWWVFGAGATALAAAAIVLLVVVPRGSSPTYRGTIHAQAGASYVRVGAAPDEIVGLTNGTITVEVATLSPGERFRVVTADGEVEVRGTAFDVTAAHDHLRAVRVLHGRVEVRAEGSTQHVLTAGERWDLGLAKAPSDATGAIAAIAPPAPSPTAPGATTPTAPDASATTSTSRVATSAGAATATTPRASAASSSSSSSRVATNAGTSADPRASAAGSATTSTSSTRRAGASTAAPTTSSITTSMKSSPPAAPKRPNELLFEKGWAALGKGDAAGAASTFEQAAKAAPNDPLAEDAWFWRASALARAKDGRAARALEAFLASYPRSPRAGEASAMLGWLVIDRDVDRAEALFQAAAKDRVAAVRASAEKGLAAVAHRRAQ